MPVWETLPDGRNVDVPLGDAWIAEAVRRTAPREVDYAGNDVERQFTATRAAWDALAQAFKAINVVPQSSPIYTAAMRDSYGDRRAVWANTPAPWIALGASMYDGLISAEAGRLYAQGHASPPADVEVMVRMSLDDAGNVRQHCARLTDPTCPFAPGALFIGDTNNGTNHCVSYGDWRCLLWNDAPLQPLKLLPPLIQSFFLAQRIANTMSAAGARNAAIMPGVRAITPPGRAMHAVDERLVHAVRPQPAPFVPLFELPNNGTYAPTFADLVNNPPATTGTRPDTFIPGMDGTGTTTGTNTPADTPGTTGGTAGTGGTGGTGGSSNGTGSSGGTGTGGTGGTAPDAACATSALVLAGQSRATALAWNAAHPTCPVLVPPEAPPFPVVPVLAGVAGLGLLWWLLASQKGDDR